ncbi:hypothetical protein GGR55DRAFT_40091 [Xylaria sp. FL0064]|nr:hypothetical protein GGR55DRAFT_40091 [Xylaria sp. FL0064]
MECDWITPNLPLLTGSIKEVYFIALNLGERLIVASWGFTLTMTPVGLARGEGSFLKTKYQCILASYCLLPLILCTCKWWLLVISNCENRGVWRERMPNLAV